MASLRRTLLASVGMIILRRRLQRQSGPGAAVALVALELFGPRIFRVKRLLFVALVLTLVGGIALGALWWARRSRIAAEADPWAAPAGATVTAPADWASTDVSAAADPAPMPAA